MSEHLKLKYRLVKILNIIRIPPAVLSRWAHMRQQILKRGFGSAATLCLILSFAISGCSSIRGVPQRYQSPDAIVASINLTSDDLSALQSSTSEGERNQYQNKAVAVIDQYFHQFVRNMVDDKADLSAGSAGLALGAATAATFVDNIKAKTNYALFGATMIGAFGIVDKSYYYDKTVPAIVAAMAAARAKVLLKIRTGQLEPIGIYNGVTALADLEDYYSAGTILAAIADTTARAENDREATVAEIRALDVPTDAEIDGRKKLSKSIFAINEKTLAAGNKALVALGQTQQKTVKETRLALLRAMRPPTKERLAAVQKALTDAGIFE